MTRMNLILLLGLFGLLFTSGCAEKRTVALPGGMRQTAGSSGSVLERGVHRYNNMLDVRLEGATDGPITEIFGKVVSSAPTVVSAKRYSSRVVPDNPQACWVIWRATVSGDGDAFALQTDMMEMFREISAAGGYVDIYRVPYRYNESEIALLKGLRPMDATSKSIVFVVDRELARDRELAGD